MLKQTELNDREERCPAPDAADHLAFRLFVFASAPSKSPSTRISSARLAVHFTARQIAVDQLIEPALLLRAGWSPLTIISRSFVPTVVSLPRLTSYLLSGNSDGTSAKRTLIDAFFRQPLIKLMLHL